MLYSYPTFQGTHKVGVTSDTQLNFFCVTPSTKILDTGHVEVQTQASHYSLAYQPFIQMIDLEIGRKGIHMHDKSKHEHIGYASEHPLGSDINILQSFSQFEYGNDCVSDVTMALPHTIRQLFNHLSVQV